MAPHFMKIAGHDLFAGPGRSDDQGGFGLFGQFLNFILGLLDLAVFSDDLDIGGGDDVP